MTRGSQSGRLRRVNGIREAYCQGCTARMTYGEPRAHDAWPTQLQLDQKQHALLLVAAAEFRDLCEEAGEYESVVDFIDWVGVDVLGVTERRVWPDHDGARPRAEKGGEGHTITHRHPDPIPYAGIRARKLAS